MKIEGHHNNTSSLKFKTSLREDGNSSAYLRLNAYRHVDVRLVVQTHPLAPVNATMPFLVVSLLDRDSER